MTQDTYDINSRGVLSYMKKWRYVLLTTSFLACISSLVFSLFIEDKYESSVILFPSTTSSVSRALLNDENYKEKDFLEFGEEEESEQMIQMLKSDFIRNHIIKKFNLMNHYGIDQESDFKNTNLNKEYDRNIDFYRTKYLSVKIEVLDKDPEYAANIANEIAFIKACSNLVIDRLRYCGLKILELLS